MQSHPGIYITVNTSGRGRVQSEKLGEKLKSDQSFLASVFFVFRFLVMFGRLNFLPKLSAMCCNGRKFSLWELWRSSDCWRLCAYVSGIVLCTIVHRCMTDDIMRPITCYMSSRFALFLSVLHCTFWRNDE